jgi:hypothetical protein
MSGQCDFDLENIQFINRRVTFAAIFLVYSFFLTHFLLWDF